MYLTLNFRIKLVLELHCLLSFWADFRFELKLSDRLPFNKLMGLILNDE